MARPSMNDPPSMDGFRKILVVAGRGADETHVSWGTAAVALVAAVVGC